MSLLATNISFSIHQKSILKDVSFELKPGIFTAIVGPNGAGKSTLLKILSAELYAKKGEVLLHEKNISRFKPRELSKVRSVLSQQVTIAFPFTAEEVVELGLHIHRLTRIEISAIVNEVMAEVGVEHLRDRLYPTLSGGEQQRVQLARAIAQVWEDSLFTRYLMLDEPTNNLDLAHQHTILHAAKKMCLRNLGVMAIVHDLNLAAQYADEVVFMKDGSIHAKGSPGMVMTKTIIEEVFSHPVNIYFDHNEKPFVMPLPLGNEKKIQQKITHTANGQLSYL